MKDFFRPRGFRPAIPITILSALLLSTTLQAAMALDSNAYESPQFLSDFTAVCTANQGRSANCEVELDVPAACVDGGTSASSCPIVFFFHGAGGSNNGFARSSGVHAENVIGVYPQGEDGWNTGPKSSNVCAWDDYDCTDDPDEGAFIASIISEMRLLGASGNVYLIGNSNGAALAHRLASNAGSADLPIKGIVTKVTQLLASPPRSGPGILNYNQPGSGGPQVSVLNLMGLEDGLINYEGGSSSVFGGDTNFQLMGALESMATWAAHNGCGSGPPTETGGIVYSHNGDANAGEATFYEYGGCPAGVIVEHYALGGAGHSFLSGAALDGVSIDHDLAYQFIARVEAGDGGGGTSSPTNVQTPGPTKAPVQGVACANDPDWHGKFNADHTCDHIAANPTQRCGWQSTDGTSASDACPVACDTCPTGSPVTPVTPSPTKSPVTSSPTKSPSPGPTAAPVQGVACENDPDWHGKFNADHTCDYIAANPTQRCGWQSTDGTSASDACPVACDTCPTTTTGGPTKSPVTSSPTSEPVTPATPSPTKSPVTPGPTSGPTGVPTTTPSSQPTPATTPNPTAAPAAGVPSWGLGDPPLEYTNEWHASYALPEGESLISSDVKSIMNYQPSMDVPADATANPSSCPHLESGLVDWDSLGFSPDGMDVALPADSAIIVRAGMLTSTSDSPYGRITVPSGSRLIFDDDAASGIEMHTLGITVNGSLEAGSPTCRIQGNVDITLHGEYGNLGSSSDRHLSGAAGSDMGMKGIFVTDTPGAKMDLHGKLYHPTWTRLAAHIPGNTQLETSAPSVRNTEVFLQDCVNWPEGGEVIVTTSHVKDTRGYDYNERGTIATAGIQCVTVDGKDYGKVTLTQPLEHYHHAGLREYQCEVGLLSRNIVVRGNDRSDPTDDSPLECTSDTSGWTAMPCPDTFLTGLGGHTIVVGQAEGRIRGAEFRKMGMTNVMGRYPVHFHHQESSSGMVSEVSDCSVHQSYFRAITIHNAHYVHVQRNVAFDIAGHAYYLESGVEENNHIEYNLAAFVHPINGATLMPSNTVANTYQSENILVPADHTASGFYISNAHNYVVGNAASGGWAGIQFPVLPEPADKSLRFNGVVPKDRPSLLITGNSIHSSSWHAAISGAMYEGGSLYWDESDTTSETLIYNAGRVSSQRLTRYTKGNDGKNDWFRVYNTTVWLVNVGATGWGKRSEINGFEVSDFQNRAIFVLFTVWFNEIVINCRSSNAPRVPDPGTKTYEKRLNNGNFWSGFRTYDHLMKHILTNWKVSNCGAEARGFGQDLTQHTNDYALVTIPVNGLAPEVQLISSGMEYDFPTLGGEDFVNQSVFFGKDGKENQYSMMYQSNWEDADGSWTRRKVGSGTSTVMGPAVAGKWWELDYRPGKCEVRNGWKFPQTLCDKEERKLASMFTVVMPQSGQQESAVFGMIYPNSSNSLSRRTRQGSATHFGLVGDGSETACTPGTSTEQCGDTISRSWDADLTGPHNHAQHGGWYLQFDHGTPIHLSIMKVQLDDQSTMIQAMSVPAGTVASDIHVYAESSSRIYDYSHANSVDEVRSSIDKYFLDESTSTLYWRVIAGYVSSDGTFGWVDREARGILPFSRGGLSITNYGGKSMFQLHIEVACPNSETDSTGAFCASQPVFSVPGMGCPEGEVMVAIDQCGHPSELVDVSPPPSPSPTASPSLSPTPLPTPAPSSPPTTSCIPCTNDPTPWMITQNYECATAPKWLMRNNCNLDSIWVNNLYCEARCQTFGAGYGTGCCVIESAS